MKKETVSDGKALAWLYETMPGRVVLTFLTWPPLSKAVGRFLDCGVSKLLIPPFIRKNQICMSDYQSQRYHSFNDFFTRKIKPWRRPVCKDPNILIAPCDGLLSAYRMTRDLVIPVKQSQFSIERLLNQQALAKEFEDGICLVYRLCVQHYHRYCYLDDGTKGGNHFIPGKLHTVRPIALLKKPVFTENSREYTVLRTKNFGKVIQVEVGAMLVGKIKNLHGGSSYERGQEKGMFLYGGSTVIVLLKKDRVVLPEEFFSSTERGEEIPVCMGQKIGVKA